jgi:hypothetical protein
MLDGLELTGRCCVVALGITTDGVKVPLGLWDGSTENKRVCVELLADLVERGPGCDQGVLVVLDGGKALRAAVDAVFSHVPVQRCDGDGHHDAQLATQARGLFSGAWSLGRGASCRRRGAQHRLRAGARGRCALRSKRPHVPIGFAS